MIALIQRVSFASITVSGEIIGRIDTGVLALIAVQPKDNDESVERLLRRLLAYRMFNDTHGRMNLSLSATGGGLLLVPQFTLAADTSQGNRPSFSCAATPALAEPLFETLCARAAQWHPLTAAGRFGADMKVASVNDGPVTFWLETAYH